jgi:hypothetical protein
MHRVSERQFRHEPTETVAGVATLLARRQEIPA